MIFMRHLLFHSVLDNIVANFVPLSGPPVCNFHIKECDFCLGTYDVRCFEKDIAGCTLPCDAKLNCGHNCAGKRPNYDLLRKSQYLRAY